MLWSCWDKENEILKFCGMFVRGGNDRNNGASFQISQCLARGKDANNLVVLPDQVNKCSR